ncbi:alcohol dehydrogenase [Truncatella angustata]|uniref:Alcohol dehydrogenase n=1 Tax=Truncatella angustata TaxID=152316 RepID=A0A9P8USK3_9PEZI|nr:alcohol dehydrogenase [Truncatella angustata]KAH6657536.1 alcohol dehydrogenase [Truncatella angustata]KAH8201744.1 hypothetical protein TruAng_004096 [Truncatella angustata]
MATSRSRGSALYVNEDGTAKVLRNVATPEPDAREIQVEVLYSGSNPADIAHAHLGITSTVMGYDFMGKVTKVEPNSAYRVGDLVAGYTPTGIGRPSKYGAHQPYLVAPENYTWRVPSDVPHAHAAVLSVIVCTAADALFNIFGFPLPGEQGPDGTRAGPLLIWGGSTSVGIAMMQLGRASGAHPIFVTASSKRHAMLKGLGATQCFDYSDTDVVYQIKRAVDDAKVGPILYAADCVGSPDNAEKVTAVASNQTKLVSTRGQRDGRFQMPFATKGNDITLRIPGTDNITKISAQPAQQAQLWKGLEWAVKNYGSGFMMPAVDVFEGTAEDALRRVNDVAEGRTFGKLVLKHPLA